MLCKLYLQLNGVGFLPSFDTSGHPLKKGIQKMHNIHSGISQL